MKRLICAGLLLALFFCCTGCGYRITLTKTDAETTADPTDTATAGDSTEENTADTVPVSDPETTGIDSITEHGAIYDSPNFRRMPMDTAAVLKLYTAAVNNVKKRCPGFTKKDDQNFTEVKAGNGDLQLANRILNLVAKEVLKSTAGDSDVSVVKAHDEVKVLNNFPIYGQEYACDLTDLSLIRSAACYTDGERYKIVMALNDTSNAEPVISQYGKIMTPAPREEIVERITRYFVVLDNEKFKFDFRYTGSEIICVFNADDGKLEYLSQKMIVNIDINLDMDLIVFSTDFVKATGTAINHIEYTDFDWSEAAD